MPSSTGLVGNDTRLLVRNLPCMAERLFALCSVLRCAHETLKAAESPSNEELICITSRLILLLGKICCGRVGGVALGRPAKWRWLKELAHVQGKEEHHHAKAQEIAHPTKKDLAYRRPVTTLPRMG